METIESEVGKFKVGDEVIYSNYKRIYVVSGKWFNDNQNSLCCYDNIHTPSEWAAGRPVYSLSAKKSGTNLSVGEVFEGSLRLATEEDKKNWEEHKIKGLELRKEMDGYIDSITQAFGNVHQTFTDMNNKYSSVGRRFCYPYKEGYLEFWCSKSIYGYSSDSKSIHYHTSSDRSFPLYTYELYTGPWMEVVKELAEKANVINKKNILSYEAAKLDLELIINETDI